MQNGTYGNMNKHHQFITQILNQKHREKGGVCMLSKIVKGISVLVALIAVSTSVMACGWWFYQPKVPKSLTK